MNLSKFWWVMRPFLYAALSVVAVSVYVHICGWWYLLVLSGYIVLGFLCFMLLLIPWDIIQRRSDDYDERKLRSNR